MFRVTARTILQLGSELISSDTVAFYELIKNAYDANSPRVEIDVVVRVPHAEHEACLRAIRGVPLETLSGTAISDEVRNMIVAAIDHSTPTAGSFLQDVLNAKTLADLTQLLDQANYIDITDFGSGMSLQDLQDIYLTIGTRCRLVEKQQQVETGDLNERPILGEKGLGRLSAMRLGDVLQVKTSRSDEPHWNSLVVDWRWFSHNTDLLLNEINVTPTRGPAKSRPDECGTRLHITALKSRWTEDAVKAIAREEFSRFNDPFSRCSSIQLSLRFNDRCVFVPAYDTILFEKAHAIVRAEYSLTEGEVQLQGSVNYLGRNRSRTFVLKHADLLAITDASDAVYLRAVGPFNVEFYWYNRGALEAIDGIGTKRQVQVLVNHWSGGLMVYRDGFRVLPYGSPDDDWLDLDRKALASSGYKVNRKQIIGRVEITGRHNPALFDQTNREGIRDSVEKDVLVKLLKHILEVEFRAFINHVDDEVAARLSVTFDNIHDRLGVEERRIRASVARLIEKIPSGAAEDTILTELENAVSSLGDMMEEAKGLAESFNKGRTQLLNLAGMGMMVEVLAHELNRTTHQSLATLAEADLKNLPSNATKWISTLRSQLITIQKRLLILDPMSTSGRQVKTHFDLIEWIVQITATHKSQFDRHGIECTVDHLRSGGPGGWSVRMVKGMITQVIENVLVNSIYWLKQQKKLLPGFQPRIMITFRPHARQLFIADNGPGIAIERREEIFQPFVTTKPPGEGKGLGLYIAREIAAYHDAALYVSDEMTVHKDRLNTFVLALEAGKQ